MTPKLILYGAFDRYNYGDNLMPIVFEDYFRAMFPEKAASTEVIFASIRDSDLSRYGCRKTNAIYGVLHQVNASDAMVVVGGEVMYTRHDDLFLHALDDTALHEALHQLRKTSPHILRILATTFYHCPWAYPYMPSTEARVAYSSVGGSLPAALSVADRTEIASIINQSVHCSVRSAKAHRTLSKFVDAHLVPDSVIIISSLYPLHEVRTKVSDWVQEALPDRYIVLQAAPGKAIGQLDEVVKQVALLHDISGLPIVLLPIGYASGHDDLMFLKEVSKQSPDTTILLHDLSIWEILYTIAKAEVYYGTSLHGAITAMAYNVPHFGLNPRVRKLDEYLKQWSVPPFNKCIEFSQVAAAYDQCYHQALGDLWVKVEAQQHQVSNNLSTIIEKVLP